jgi:hypothetical protein
MPAVPDQPCRQMGAAQGSDGLQKIHIISQLKAGRAARTRHSTVTLFARFLTLGLWLRPGLSALHIAGAM